MKNHLLVHGSWGVAALAAFGIGSLLKSQDRASGDGRERGRPASGWNANGAPNDIASPIVSALGKSKGGGSQLARAKREPLSERDILDLGAIVKTNGSPVTRRLAFAKLLEGVTAENALLIREQLLGIDQDSAEWRDFHYAWGAAGGSDAVQFGMESPERDMAMGLAGWASAAPAAAMAWFDSLPPNQRSGNGELKYGMASGLADRNPDAAASFAFDLAAAGDKDAARLLGSVASKVVRNEGVQNAASWTETLQAGPLRAAAMDRVAHEYVDFDPVAATRWAERFNNEPHSARIIEEVADEVGRRDPQHAADWLASLEPSLGRTQGYRSAFRHLARQNRAVAVTRVNEIAEPADRDAALTGVAIEAGRQHEAAAFDFVGRISDYEARVGAVKLAAPEFAKLPTQEAASQWVLSNMSGSVVWLEGRPEDNSRFAAPRDAAVLSEWISNLPPGHAAAASAAIEGRGR